MWMYVAYIHNACMHASMSIEINVLPLSNHMLFWCHSNYLWFGRVPCSEEEKVWMEQLLPWCAQEEVVACSISAPNLLRRPGINETPKYRFIRKLGNSSFACVCMCYMYVCAYVSMNVHMCVCMYVWMDLCMQVYMYACIVCVHLCMSKLSLCSSMHASKPVYLHMSTMCICIYIYPNVCLCLNA